MLPKHQNVYLIYLILITLPTNSSSMETGQPITNSSTETCSITKNVCQYIMLESGHSFNILSNMIEDYYQKPINSTGTSKYSDLIAKYKNDIIELDKLLKERSEIKRTLINYCIEQLNAGRVNGALETFSKIGDRNLTERIIQDAYNLTNFHIILKFIEQLTMNDFAEDQHLMGISTFEYLFDEMIRNDHIYQSEVFTFAFALKALQIKCNHLDCLKQLNVIRNRLPKCVQLIVWSDNICMKNVFYNEYLFADTNQNLYNENRRYVLSWMAAGEKFPDQGNGWTIEKINGQHLFAIKNSYYKEYLYAVYDGAIYDQQRRRVFTWIPGNMESDAIWTIEIVSSSVIRLKNVEYNNEYFTISGPDAILSKNKRLVFTWIPVNDSNSKQEFNWKLENC